MLWGSDEISGNYRRSNLIDGDPKMHPKNSPLTRYDEPVAGTRRPLDRRSRVQRWRNAVAELVAVQRECEAWLQALPDSLQESPTAEALEAICDLDLGDLEAIEPPRGFGRD